MFSKALALFATAVVTSDGYNPGWLKDHEVEITPGCINNATCTKQVRLTWRWLLIGLLPDDPLGDGDPNKLWRKGSDPKNRIIANLQITNTNNFIKRDLDKLAEKLKADPNEDQVAMLESELSHMHRALDLCTYPPLPDPRLDPEGYWDWRQRYNNDDSGAKDTTWQTERFIGLLLDPWIHHVGLTEDAKGQWMTRFFEFMPSKGVNHEVWMSKDVQENIESFFTKMGKPRSSTSFTEPKEQAELRKRVKDLKGRLAANYHDSLSDDAMDDINTLKLFDPDYWSAYWKMDGNFAKEEWYVTWDTSIEKTSISLMGDKKNRKQATTVRDIIAPYLNIVEAGNKDLAAVDPERNGSPTPRILQLGSGLGKLCDKMYKDGYEKQTLLDISSKLMKFVEEQKSTSHPEMQFQTGDLRDMDFFDDEAFDVVIDKGTLDIFVSGSSDNTAVTAGWTDLGRVLRSHGLLITITTNTATIGVSQSAAKQGLFEKCVMHPIRPKLGEKEYQGDFQLSTGSLYIQACQKA